jgi:hypothetical protein
VNFLLLATLAVIDIFFSGYKRNDRDNEAHSSKDKESSLSTETAYENLNDVLENI